MPRLTVLGRTGEEWEVSSVHWEHKGKRRDSKLSITGIMMRFLLSNSGWEVIWSDLLRKEGILTHGLFFVFFFFQVMYFLCFQAWAFTICLSFLKCHSAPMASCRERNRDLFEDSCNSFREMPGIWTGMVLHYHQQGSYPWDQKREPIYDGLTNVVLKAGWRLFPHLKLLLRKVQRNLHSKSVGV